jgi:predicted XRE-type DNA-binding protein
MLNLKSPLELLTKDPIELGIISIKTKLMIILTSSIRKNGWSQSQAAKSLNVSQPRISNLMNGQISKFSVDVLIEMLGRMDYIMDISFDLSSETPISIDVKKSAEEAADLN